MDAAAFEQVYQAFGEFHSLFGPLFGRSESREHSLHYLQALLVQSGERRNAENLSESVGVSARAMQRFLSKAPWDDDAVMGRLQEYLAPRLEHAPAGTYGGGVGAGRQRLSQAGPEVGGSDPAILRTAGQGGQLPGGDVLGIRESLGPGPGGQAAVPAGELDLGQGPLRCCGSAGREASVPVEDGVGLGDSEAGLGAGPSGGRLGSRG